MYKQGALYLHDKKMTYQKKTMAARY